MQVLHKIRQEQPNELPTQQHPAFKIQIQQEVDRMEAEVGIQEDWR